MAEPRPQLLDQVIGALGPDGVERISRQLGADRAATERGIAAALPVLLGGLTRQAESGRADELDRALEQDHDGSLVDQLGAMLGGGGAAGNLGGLGGLLGGAGGGLGGLLGGSGGGGGGLGGLLGGLLGGGAADSRAADGDGILRHVLGDKRRPVEEGVSRASGLGAGQVGQLLAMLAPLLMGVLGRAKRNRGLDGGGLTDLLRRERQAVENEVVQASTGATAPAGATAAKPSRGIADFLDFDGDGDISDEVAKIGAAMAGAMLLGKLHKGR